MRRICRNRGGKQVVQRTDGGAYTKRRRAVLAARTRHLTPPQRQLRAGLSPSYRAWPAHGRRCGLWSMEARMARNTWRQR